MSVAPQVVDEHELYPIHEEDSVPERPVHEAQVRYLRSALSVRLPQHWVTGEVCMYWVERAFNLYVAPDVLVVQGPPDTHPHDVFLAWSDGPALLVIEVGSKSTFREDEGPKIERYLLDLAVREYLYFRPHPNPRRRSLQMWRSGGDEVAEVVPSVTGRFVSQSLDLEFGPDADGFLRIYERDGRMLPTPEEEHELAEQERRRAEQERRRADAAEAAAAAERTQRMALERELEQLRRQLPQQNDSDLEPGV